MGGGLDVFSNSVSGFSETLNINGLSGSLVKEKRIDNSMFSILFILILLAKINCRYAPFRSEKTCQSLFGRGEER